MPCSPAQREANRKNAQRSCGPKTAEGKARSRANALKHGLAGVGVVLPEPEERAVADRLDALGVAVLARPSLARRVAVLTDRLDRLARHDEASTARRLREAEAGVDQARHNEVDALLGSLLSDPVASSRQLRATPEGCDRLIAFWHDLARCVDAGMAWSRRYRERAEALSGHDPSFFAPSDWELIHYSWETPLPPTAADPTGRDPDRVAAHQARLRRQLSERIAAEIQALGDHRLALVGDLDHEARSAEAKALALFDDSPQAALLRRYEMASERGLYRALRELERPMPQPEPAPTEEPPIPPETSVDEEDAPQLASFGGDTVTPNPNQSQACPDLPASVSLASICIDGQVAPGCG